MSQAPVEIETTTVFCVAIHGQSIGGVDWFRHEKDRNKHPHDFQRIWFDLDVPADATPEEITSLADAAMWEEWYEDGQSDCRLRSPTLRSIQKNRQS